MKRLLILFLTGCVLIGVGVGITAFELTTYEIMDGPVEHNSQETFTIDLKEKTDLYLQWNTSIKILYDEGLSESAKIVAEYTGNEGDLKLRMETNRPPAYHFYDLQSDHRNVFRDFMKDLKDRKIQLNRYHDAMDITIYVNEKDEPKLNIL